MTDVSLCSLSCILMLGPETEAVFKQVLGPVVTSQLLYKCSPIIISIHASSHAELKASCPYHGRLAKYDRNACRHSREPVNPVSICRPVWSKTVLTIPVSAVRCWDWKNTLSCSPQRSQGFLLRGSYANEKHQLAS